MAVLEIEKLLKGEFRADRLAHDPRFEEGVGYVNCRYCSRSEAVVPLFDLGFTQSDVTYEVATVSRGRFFRLQDHFARFARSCNTLRLKNPYSDEEMTGIFTTLLRMAGLKDAGIYWCVTRGQAKNPRDRRNPAAFENRFYASAYPYGSLANDEERVRGLNLMISKKYIRIPVNAVDPTVKNCHWLDMKLSLFEATEQGMDWSVLADASGYLTEAPGANIFVVKNGEIYTPDSGCLEGITRKTALELAAEISVRAHVEKVHADQLKQADDAFITSSAGGIIPVNSVDGILLGGVKGPGPLSALLHNLYWEKLWAGWKCAAVDYTGGN